MSLRVKRFGQAAITTSDVTLYTCPDDTMAMLKCFDICNTTAAGIEVNVHLVPEGDAVGTDNAMIFEGTITANSIYEWRGTQVFEAGDFFSVKAGGAGLTITVSGTEEGV